MRWIKIGIDDPPNGSHLLVTDGNDVISSMKLNDGWLAPPFMKITHWAPLPSPPKEK